MSDEARRIDELDDLLSEQVTISAGSWLPAFACFVALIDAGLLDRRRVLEIMSTSRELGERLAPVGESDEFCEGLDFLLNILRSLPEDGRTEQENIRSFLQADEVERFVRNALRRRGSPPTEPSEP